jgi:hypothetical protein
MKIKPLNIFEKRYKKTIFVIFSFRAQSKVSRLPIKLHLSPLHPVDNCNQKRLRKIQVFWREREKYFSLKNFIDSVSKNYKKGMILDQVFDILKSF